MPPKIIFKRVDKEETLRDAAKKRLQKLEIELMKKAVEEEMKRFSLLRKKTQKKKRNRVAQRKRKRMRKKDE